MNTLADPKVPLPHIWPKGEFTACSLAVAFLAATVCQAHQMPLEVLNFFASWCR